MLPRPDRPTVVTHWGTYAARLEGGALVALDPYAGDPDPSSIAESLLDPETRRARVLRPAVRASVLAALRAGTRPSGEGRGREPFVEVAWDEALDLVAGEIGRVRRDHGSGAIYGGSYGWASAGRFHHAQSQVHRFLNAVGGYVRSVNTYSTGAAEVIVPHVLGDTRGLNVAHTTWPVIARNASLVVMFGGAPRRNAQVNSGGIGRHTLRESLLACRGGGAEFVSISPIRDDAMPELEARWLPVRPTTDVALMLGIAYVLDAEDLCDRAFLARYTSGFERFRAYLTGAADGVPKSPEWASAIAGLEAGTIRDLARAMAGRRTFITMAWALQRAEHGEQPYWMAITLAAMLGQIGLPGGGFGFGYGSVNGIGVPVHGFAWPSLPQRRNAIADFIPVARVADMLLDPGGCYDYDGAERCYPDIRLIYWAGGNPFHHHQDLNRLVRAWRRPETVVVHESWWNGLARHADIVLPAATQLERDDLACSSRDRLISPSHRVREPDGESRADYDIFAALARRLGAEEAFTEGLDAEGWIRRLYASARRDCAAAGAALPDFEAFWRGGPIVLPEPNEQPALLEDFRRDPDRHRLATASGRIEIASDTIAAFGYADCPAHPTWLEPQEWLGAPGSARFPLHLISNQPPNKLHSQYDHGAVSRADKVAGRETVRIHPLDAEARGLRAGDAIRLFNDRGACLAIAVPSEGVVRGVVQMATGAWFNPVVRADGTTLEVHGNPNVLTRDAGTSRLGQGTIAHSCLVEAERFDEALPLISAFDRPVIRCDGR